MAKRINRIHDYEYISSMKRREQRVKAEQAERNQKGDGKNETR